MGERVPIIWYERDAFLRAAVGLTLLSTGFVFGLELATGGPVDVPALVTVVASTVCVLAAYIHNRNNSK
jgi:hypothetical protein